MRNIRGKLTKIENVCNERFCNDFFLVFQNYQKEEYFYKDKKFESLDQFCTSNNIDKNSKNLFIISWYRDCEEEKICV